MLSRVKGAVLRKTTGVVQRGTADLSQKVETEVGESKRLLAEYIDSRINDVAGTIVSTSEAIAGQRPVLDRLEASQVEGLTYVSQELRRVHDLLDRSLLLGRDGTEVIAKVREGDASVIDAEIATLLNVAVGHSGPLQEKGLFLNPAVGVSWRPGGVDLVSVNERVAELPFIFSALDDLEPGSRILDVGAAESTVSLSLATLGHQVTALDPRGYPFAHPNLTENRSRVGEFRPEDGQGFDAIVLLSTIEHIGLSSYAGDTKDDGGDRRALEHCIELLAPGGRIVLTTPYGKPDLTPLERIYGPDELDALLQGLEVTDRRYLHRIDATTWAAGEDRDRPGCVMVTARPA